MRIVYAEVGRRANVCLNLIELPASSGYSGIMMSGKASQRQAVSQAEGEDIMKSSRHAGGRERQADSRREIVYCLIQVPHSERRQG